MDSSVSFELEVRVLPRGPEGSSLVDPILLQEEVDPMLLQDET